MTRHLVTSALPYANGPIHFGHAIGAYLPADVYVRYLRQRGEEVRFVCGSDEHGVAITIGAEAKGQSYPEYVAHWHSTIENTLRSLGIEFDIFSGTSTSAPHAELSQHFFRQLDANGYLLRQASRQLFCKHDDFFLADRYVTGTCPKCEFEGARGDECPRCGEWLDPLTLIDPACKVCGNRPVERETTHWYLDLPKLRDAGVGDWFAGKEWKPNVSAFVKGLLADLAPRPITRDMKWGVPVPPEIAGDEEGKVLYVWFDAPIGYISFHAELEPEGWRDWWQNPDTKLVHFIGKDNIPFHCLVFPSMLHGVGEGFVLPDAVPAMEFYNLQGRKFNTSSGWVLDLDTFFAKYDAEATRFYLLASAPETSDSEWRWEDFQSCVNAGLADTIGNLVTRVLRFSAKHFDGCVPPLDEAHRAELDAAILTECGALADPGEALGRFRFRQATSDLLANAAVANVFIDRLAPWSLRKTDLAKCGSVLNTAAEWLLLLARQMAPFMPQKAQALFAMLGQSGAVTDGGWPGLPGAGWRAELGGTPLGEVAGLFDKLDDATVQAELDALAARSAD